MLEADSGGGGGTDITVHTGRLRDVAKQYSGLVEKAQSYAKEITSSGHSASGAIHHAAVADAVQGAVTALSGRLGLVGMGLDHCDRGLTACAEDYDKADESSAQKAEQLRSEWAAK